MGIGNRLRGRGPRGFTLIEIVVVICILGIIAAVALPKYVSMSKASEAAAAEGVIGALAGGLNAAVMKQIAAGLPVTAHNPFDDLVKKPENYVGAFPDVDLNNCPPGHWAYQIGHAANGNWPVVAYRAKERLTTAFSWGGVQWIIFEVRPVTDAAGRVISLGLVEYAPKHRW